MHVQKNKAVKNLPVHELDLVSKIPTNPLTASLVLHPVAVYLYHDVELVTLGGTTHYKQGPSLIPSDLARTLYRSHSAIPLRAYKQSR